MAMPHPELTYSGPGGPRGEPTTLTTMDQVEDLAAWLQSPHRDRVVLVLTIADRQPEPKRVRVERDPDPRLPRK